MDFDLNAALNDSPAYICASESCPQPAASATPPPQLSSAALANPSARRPTTYQDLPSELIARIGDYIPVQDVMRLSTVNRRTYDAMQTRRLVHRYWQRANQAVSVESFNQLLNEMDGTLVDPAQHAEPLDVLCQRLRVVYCSKYADVFKRLFAAAQRIPQNGVQIQKALLLMCWNYAYEELESEQDFDSEWLELFDFAHALASQREPGQDDVWLELVFGLYAFPYRSSELAERYQALLVQLPSLSVPQQAKLIPALSKLLKRLPGPSISARHASLREQARQLPPSYQGASVGALAGELLSLLEEERPAIYAQMRDWALSLPDDQWGIALRDLPGGYQALPPQQQAQELALLERYLARVPAAQRVQAAVGIISCIRFMNETLSKQVWQQGLSLLNGTDETTLRNLLVELRSRWVLWPMALSKWEIARDAITRFMESNQFSTPAQARIQDSMVWLSSRPDY
jgi:hypothetical protein